MCRHMCTNFEILNWGTTLYTLRSKPGNGINGSFDFVKSNLLNEYT